MRADSAVSSAEMRACTRYVAIPCIASPHRTRDRPVQYGPASSMQLPRPAKACIKHASTPPGVSPCQARSHPTRRNRLAPRTRPSRPAQARVKHATISPDAACAECATALNRRKPARPREQQVEKFNGSAAIAFEKRCISQPVARKTNPDNPLWSRQPRHSTVYPHNQPPGPARPSTPAPPNAKNAPHAGRQGVAACGALRQGDAFYERALCEAYSTPASLRPTR